MDARCQVFPQLPLLATTVGFAAFTCWSASRQVHQCSVPFLLFCHELVFLFNCFTTCQSRRTSTRSQRPMWSMCPSFCQSCGNESLVLGEQLITCRVCVMAHSFAFLSLMSISFSTILISFPLSGGDSSQSRTCSETQDSAPAFQRGSRKTGGFVFQDGWR